MFIDDIEKAIPDNPWITLSTNLGQFKLAAKRLEQAFTISTGAFSIHSTHSTNTHLSYMATQRISFAVKDQKQPILVDVSG